MFIHQLNLTSGFGEFHFLKELLTAVGATKEEDHFSCMTYKLGNFPQTEFVKVHKTIFRISPLGVHVCLQFNEFHLAIVRTVFHCQVKKVE